MSTPNSAAVATFYATLARGDLPGVLDLLADVVWSEAPGTPYAAERPYRGAAEIAEHVLGPITTALPDLAVTVEQVIDLGATIAVHGTYTATPATDPVAAPTAGAARMQVGFVHIWQVDHARLTAFHQVTDADKFTALTTTATMAAMPHQ